MNNLFPSFFAGRKSPMPPAASAATAAREVREYDLQRMQQVQQPAMAEIDYCGKPRASDAASAAGRERGNQARPQAAPTPVALAPSWRARAASLEHDAGLSIEWAEPFARLLCGSPPRGFEPHRWARAVEGASIFAERWATQAFRLGWSAEEVFGLDEIEPDRRHDRKGLAWFLTNGRRVIALNSGGADTETGRGTRQRFYRMNETISDTRKGRTP